MVQAIAHDVSFDDTQHHNVRSSRRSNVVDHPTGYAKVMNDVARSHRLNAQELGVYTLILGYCGPAGECWTDQETLAGFIGLSVRSFQRHLKHLVEEGFLSERVRRESQGELKGRAYSVSDAWRFREPGKSPATGVVRVTSNSESHTTPVPKSHDKIDTSHTTPVAGIKRTREKDPEKVLPELPVSGGVGGADAPAPPPQDEKPKRTSRRATKTPKANETPCPDAIELTDVSYGSAEKLGYTRAETDRELDAFMTKARAKGWHYVNWREGFKSWLISEITYGRGPATLGPLAPARQNGHRNGQTGYGNGYGQTPAPGKAGGAWDPDIAAHGDALAKQDWWSKLEGKP